MTGARVLAIGGFVAGILSAVGGALIASHPMIGGGLITAANVTMLACNAVVALMKEERQ